MQDHQLVQALVQIGDIAREAGLLAVNDLVQLPALLARIPSPVCQTAMRRSRTHDRRRRFALRPRSPPWRLRFAPWTATVPGELPKVDL